MNDKVRVEVADAVATITFARPAVYNAMDGGMIEGFRAACEGVQHDPAVRCVVLRGEGPAFVAGGDVAVFHQHLDELPALILDLARELHLGVLAIRRMAKPVLASVHGAVAGAGLSVMAACDLAIAAEGTKFTMAYSRLGTSPDGGGSFFLARALGLKKALELIMLSDTFDPATALSLGLVNRVVPAADLATETARLARRLADGPTLAYAETKRLVDAAFEASLETQLEAEAQAFARCARTADLREGITAFVEKRKPDFHGR